MERQTRGDLRHLDETLLTMVALSGELDHVDCWTVVAETCAFVQDSGDLHGEALDIPSMEVDKLVVRRWMNGKCGARGTVIASVASPEAKLQGKTFFHATMDIEMQLLTELVPESAIVEFLEDWPRKPRAFGALRLSDGSSWHDGLSVPLTVVVNDVLASVLVRSVSRLSNNGIQVEILDLGTKNSRWCARIQIRLRVNGRLSDGAGSKVTLTEGRGVV